VLAGAALLVVLVLVAVAVVLLNGHGKGKGSGSSADRAGVAPAVPADPKAAPSGPPSAAAAASASATGPAGSAQPSPAGPAGDPPAGTGAPAPGATVPDGYRMYRDASGFSIVLPQWLADEGKGYDATSHVFEGNGLKLLVDWTVGADPSALADWQSGEKNLNARNYHRIQLQAITYRQWTNAADWEWTSGSGTTNHSLNRGFVTGNGKYGYALLWTSADADWNSAANTAARTTGFDSFQPAP
jgi:hypothetical protein